MGKDSFCFQRTSLSKHKQKQQGSAASGATRQHEEYWSAQTQILSKLFEGITGKKISKKQLENKWDS